MDFVIFCIFCCFLAPICIFVLFFGEVYEWGDWLGLGNEGGDKRYGLRDAMRKLPALGLLCLRIPYFITSFKSSKYTLQFRSW